MLLNQVKMKSPVDTRKDLVGSTFQEFFHELVSHQWLPQKAILDKFEQDSKAREQLHKMVLSLASSGGQHWVSSRIADFVRGNTAFDLDNTQWTAKQKEIQLSVFPEPSNRNEICFFFFMF